MVIVSPSSSADVTNDTESESSDNGLQLETAGVPSHFSVWNTDQFGLLVAIPELIVDDNPCEFRYVEMSSNVVDPK